MLSSAEAAVGRLTAVVDTDEKPLTMTPEPLVADEVVEVDTEDAELDAAGLFVDVAAVLDVVADVTVVEVKPSTDMGLLLVTSVVVELEEDTVEELLVEELLVEELLAEELVEDEFVLDEEPLFDGSPLVVPSVKRQFFTS